MYSILNDSEMTRTQCFQRKPSPSTESWPKKPSLSPSDSLTPAPYQHGAPCVSRACPRLHARYYPHGHMRDTTYWGTQQTTEIMEQTLQIHFTK